MKFRGSINQAISALIIDPEMAVPEYVLYWLNANVRLWKRSAASSRKDPNITQSDVASFPIQLPPLIEQQRIVDVISTEDEELHLRYEYTEQLLTQKRGLMQQLLTGQIRVGV